MQSLNEIQEEAWALIDESADLPATEILTDNEQNNIGNITTTSKVGVLRNLVYVFSKIVFEVQKLWEQFKIDINTILANGRDFTEKGWINLALNYQHGYELNENNSYDLPATPQEATAIAAAKVIKKAAIQRVIINGVGALRFKLATGDSQLEPISANQLLGFKNYMDKVGAAGVFVNATTGDPDDLKLHYRIYFDGTILDNEGKRQDGTDDTPIQDAIKAYLRTQNQNNFNGALSLARLNDVVQQVPGVVDPFIVEAASKFAAYDYGDEAENVGEFEEYRQPDSGYFQLDDANSTFEFIAS